MSDDLTNVIFLFETKDSVLKMNEKIEKFIFESCDDADMVVLEDMSIINCSSTFQIFSLFEEMVKPYSFSFFFRSFRVSNKEVCFIVKNKNSDFSFIVKDGKIPDIKSLNTFIESLFQNSFSRNISDEETINLIDFNCVTKKTENKTFSGKEYKGQKNKEEKEFEEQEKKKLENKEEEGGW